jgi:hypothetical protein
LARGARPALPVVQAIRLDARGVRYGKTPFSR